MMKKTETITFKMSPDEKKRIQLNAKNNDVSVTTYLLMLDKGVFSNKKVNK